jgi:hypothetical protein
MITPKRARWPTVPGGRSDLPAVVSVADIEFLLVSR